MAKPTPDVFRISDHNILISNTTSTTQKAYSNAHIIYTAANTSTEIPGANLSYGMNLPPHTREVAGSGSFYKSNVPKSRIISLQVQNVQVGATALAQANITLVSTGSGLYFTDTSANFGGNFQRNFTWLHSGGTNSNYYANLNITSSQTWNPVSGSYTSDGATANLGGSAINTDLILSSTRTWGVRFAGATNGERGAIKSGNLILKYSTDGGTTKEEFFRRPVYLEVYSERST